MNRELEATKSRRDKGRAVAVSKVGEPWTVAPGSPEFPARLAGMLPWVGDRALHGIGERQILNQKSLGLICSVQCPGSVVIKTFDAIRELRDAGVVVAGGFHSPMEQECLDFLLRGDQPVIVSPAKGLCRPRLSAAWRTDIDAGRLLLLSPFGNTVTRTTAAQAETRNEFIAALSHAVLIPHASTGGKAAAIARQILERGQPLFTFDDDENSELLKLGAQTYQIPELKALIRPAVE